MHNEWILIILAVAIITIGSLAISRLNHPLQAIIRIVSAILLTGLVWFVPNEGVLWVRLLMTAIALVAIYRGFITLRSPKNVATDNCK